MKFLKATIYLSTFLFLFSIPSIAHGADVFYSVGQTASDLKTGTLTVTIASGVATFSVAQTGNIGVGDRVTYNTTSIAYISSKTSTTVWNLVTATGGTPADVSGQTVNSITREYTSLSAAEAGATDSNHLNTSDLVSGNYVLNFPCYYDTGADTTAVAIDGWTTGASNYIKIYTPNNTTTEVNQSQRHSGVWDDNKYVLNFNTNQLQIRVNNIKIDGLQIRISSFSGTAYGTIQDVANNAGERDIEISNNILRGKNFADNRWGGFYGSGLSASGVVKIWNNIFYDWTSSGAYVGGIMLEGYGATAYIYNNTFYNNKEGIRSFNGGSAPVAKNNLFINCPTNAAYGTFAAGSGYNATDNASMGYTVTGGAVGDRTSQTFSFINETRDDFHLDHLDAGARNQGVDLSADVNLPITTDIDGHTRPNQTVFDIGADEATTKIYRSVGPSATSALAVGTSNALTISGSTATFVSALPNNVGVGDALQYDDDGDNDIDVNDSIVFIFKRNGANSFQVQTASGAAPTAVAGDTDWSLFRAYSSLSRAEGGTTENTSIDSDLRNFDTWSGGKNLVTSNEQWNIALYANGTTADTTAVVINDWTTGANNYIRVFTPVLTSEVGVSQRHSGKWTNEAYSLVVPTTSTTLDIKDNQIRIDGLQIYGTGASGGQNQINFDDTNQIGTREAYISNNIIKVDTDNAGNPFGIMLQRNSGRTSTAFIWNNIVYNYAGATAAGILVVDAKWTAYVYNNTVENCATGIKRDNGALVAKNNLVKGSGNTNAYVGTFASGTDYNATDGTDAIGQGSNNRISQTFSFADSANDDFHLSSTDTGAKGYGVDLAVDLYLPFQNDIDGDHRSGGPDGSPWDIGADEYVATTLRSPDLPGGSQFKLNMSLTDKMTDGLVGMWSFDGANMDWSQATAEARDTSGNANHGDVSGATATVGKRGQALSFDGNDDYVKTSSAVNFGGTKTITTSFWLKQNSYNNLDGFVMELSSNLNTFDGTFAINPNSSNPAPGKFTFSIQDSITTGKYRIESITRPSVGDWHFYSAVFDNSTTEGDIIVYVDGVEQSTVVDFNTKNQSSDFRTDTLNFMSRNGASLFNDGSLDEVRIYNRALSVDEIGDLYRLGQAKIRR